MQSSTYDQFIAHVKQTMALGQIGGILSWDQEVMMPANGAAARAEQMAALEEAVHARRTDSRMGDWLVELEATQLDDVAAANVRLARRSYDRSLKVPAKLAAELARTTSMAQQVWAKARAGNSYSDFAPTLEQIIALKREEANCLKQEDATLYDALLDDFEPGMKTATLQPLLEGMRPRLTDLRQRIADKAPEQPALAGTFATDAQMALAREFADVVGYDWQSGRLDLSVHPFSSGTGGDARITTRVDPSEPLGCLYSTLHELGHALYEQGMPRDHALTPVGQHVSMGVHESQSRLWENQIGRSLPFCAWLLPKMKAAFPDLTLGDTDHLYRILNRVETGFIRTEADEVHYNLHVLLRFELERELIAGDLEVGDLEAEWNRRFKRDFGLSVPDAAHGVLQDIHWSAGLFGYFPTYALGNIYAAQLNSKLRVTLPGLDAQLEIGKTSSVLAWLRDAVHSKGSLHAPDKLMEIATGEKVSSEPLLNYLEAKYSDLFML